MPSLVLKALDTHTKSALRPLLAVCAFACLAGAPAIASDAVPHLNVDASCRAAAKLESLDKKQFQSCLDDEAASHKLVEKEWSTFAAAARSECYRETTMGGTPSYVEMLECLRLARDSKKYPAN